MSIEPYLSLGTFATLSSLNLQVEKLGLLDTLEATLLAAEYYCAKSGANGYDFNIAPPGMS